MAKIDFQNTILNANQAPKQIKEKMSLDTLKFLIKLTKTRIDYCSARMDLEKARILGKKGEHIKAAEIFANTASQFIALCKVYKIEREHRELEAIYHLCRAWEQMELAEEYLEPERFTRAADQFTKASDFSTEPKYKLLASGNSAYCMALEHGCEFDKSYDSNIKAQLYPKIKSILRNAASLYEKGGFKGAANWALATSTYFDAAWHLIRADELLKIDEKQEILRIASNYLESASELFSKGGYINKAKEILDYLERVRKEEEIHISALHSITTPVESFSTLSISAPACPLESNKPKIEDIQMITQRTMQETRQVSAEKEVEKEKEPKLSVLVKEEPVVLLIMTPGGVPIFSYPFVDEWKLDDEFFGGFLSSFSSMSDELFSEGLDRAKFGSYTVLMESISDLLICYLFKGQIFMAKEKLTQFLDSFQKDASFLQTLKKYQEVGQVVELTDIPSLEILINEIFVQKQPRKIPDVVDEKKLNKIKVFISYATADSIYFQIPRINDELMKYPEIDKILYWEEDLKDDIYDYMDSNIGECDIFLLFCSQNALESDPVKMEWQAALKIKKKIIPIFTKEAYVPTLLSTKLGVVFKEEAFDATIEQIHGLILKKLEI
jgi:hypothetical protein